MTVILAILFIAGLVILLVRVLGAHGGVTAARPARDNGGAPYADYSDVSHDAFDAGGGGDGGGDCGGDGGD